jgi:hypothetical protein
MQAINSSQLTTQAPFVPGATSSVPAQEQRTRAVVREESKAQNAQTEQNAKQRLDIDEKALALVEREQLQPFDNGNASNQGSSQRQFNSSSYDNPSQQNQSAVATYQSVGAIAQRDSIQQVFGVDLFA